MFDKGKLVWGKYKNLLVLEDGECWCLMGRGGVRSMLLLVYKLRTCWGLLKYCGECLVFKKDQLVWGEKIRTCWRVLVFDGPSW